jgi:hypothetical protein
MNMTLVKAFVIGNASHVISVAALTIVWSVFIVLVVCGAQNGVEGISSGVAELTSSSAFNSLFVASAIIPGTLVAGYVGARISGRHPLLTGALSTSAWVSIAILGPIYGLPFSDTSNPDFPLLKGASLFLSYGLPIFGALGGYVAKLRPAQVATTPNQSGSGRLFASREFAVIRWMLAFFGAMCVYAVMSIATAVIGDSGFVWAVLLAVPLGTSLVSFQDRKAAGLAFIAIATLIPAGTFAWHLLFVGLKHAHSLPVAFNLLGAALSYPALQWFFPVQFQTKPGKWWWISSFDYKRWSSEERSARIGLAVTGTAVWVSLYFLVTGAAQAWYLDSDIAACAAILLAGPVALFAARPVFSWIQPRTLAKGDRSACLRLSAQTQGIFQNGSGGPVACAASESG